MNHATRRPLTGGGRVVDEVRGTKGLILAHSCCCWFLSVRTLTRASFAQRVAFVEMLCQFSMDELEAAARGISRRSHRMAARRRRMVTNGSPTGRLRSRAVQASNLRWDSGFCASNEWTSVGHERFMRAEARYILAKVEAASRAAMRASDRKTKQTRFVQAVKNAQGTSCDQRSYAGVNH